MTCPDEDGRVFRRGLKRIDVARWSDLPRKSEGPLSSVGTDIHRDCPDRHAIHNCTNVLLPPNAASLTANKCPRSSKEKQRGLRDHFKHARGSVG